LFILAISIAFVSVVPAAQAWQEQGMQVYGEHAMSGVSSGVASPQMGKFSPGDVPQAYGEHELLNAPGFTGKLPQIYYREKYPDEIPL
jgi:hypothetical protein